MKEFRSNCPLARSLDIVVDKWTLLILRDISAFGKTTFKEISQMPEKIATNTLSDRLERLTGEGLITKTQSKKNKLVYHYNITEKAAEVVNSAKNLDRKVCAIGTTSMRTIESSVSASGILKPSEGWTNLFIYPPYDFSIANAMITNFHLPKTSLIIMVCAFGGFDLVMEAYEEAIKEKYRFYSYGDAMLII